ncbi:hypothetical protein AMECASPLE_006429 [Ameca splendens]|uniref:Uncharacterized protein n=1 Tax=Ameca splendens TaxID=208324 RepID=A0ABV0ZV96_9TELE
MDFRHQTPVHTSLELFKIKCINLLLAQLKKGATADFLWRHYPNKAQFRRGKGKGGGGGVAEDCPHISPHLSTTLSLPRGLPEVPDRRGKRANVFCWQKDINSTGSKAIRSSIICKVK